MTKLQAAGAGFFLGGLLGLLLALAVWSGGRSATLRAEEKTDRVTKRLDVAKVEAATCLDRQRVFEAHVSLSHVTRALRRENFGTARDRLLKSQSLLSALVASPPEGANVGLISEAADALAATDLSVTEPVAAQIERIMGAGHRLEDAL